MNKIALWTSLSFFLSSCGFQSVVSEDVSVESDGKSITTYAFKNNGDIAGKVALPVANAQQQYWLLTSENEGLLLTDAQGNTLARYKSSIELLDRRADVTISGKTYDLLVTTDKENGKVLLIGLDWQAQQFSLLNSFSYNGSIETLCLQTLPEGHTGLFIADESGMLTQSVLVNGNQQTLTNVVLRSFVGVPQAKGCAVDDRSNALYISEENVGVWRYSANPEAELQRELVVATGRLGKLEGEVASVDVLTDGSLLIAVPEQQGLWHVDPANDYTQRFIKLDNAQAIESARALSIDNSLLVGLYNDKTERYQNAILPLPINTPSNFKAGFPALQALAETVPVGTSGDAADDPAIWLNGKAPNEGRILGTNKKRGLDVYDLQGQLIQRLEIGRLNNVDVRYGFKFSDKTVDIAAASNRTTKSLSLFAIDQQSGVVSYLQDIPTGLDDVYGLCMGRIDGKFYVFVNDTNGDFQQYLLNTEGKEITAKKIRQFKVASQPEGCVVDDENALLYFGEEELGIWQVSAIATKEKPKLIASLNDTFVADVEGMGIYYVDGNKYLLASSQGNDSYGVFALDQGGRYLGSFSIGLNLAERIDGVSETDGLEIVSGGLGARFPLGLMVVQDGRNVMPAETQNFKLVDAKPIAELIRKWLKERADGAK